MSSPSLDTALVLDHTELRAENPVEFRRLLDRIREAAGLSCGQIAVKAQMPRSQAYNLVSKTRTTLPSRREQVAAFVKACNLAPVQMDIVLDTWRKLYDKQVEQRSQAHQERVMAAAELGGLGEHNRADVVEILKRLVDNDPVELQNLSRALVGGAGPEEPTRLPRNARLIDLVHSVVSNDLRLRRALRLLYPFLALVMVTIAALIMLAIYQPNAAMFTMASTGGLATIVATVAAMRRARQ
jgi:hypothetical protein